jgi:hypothetical protein
MSGSGVSQVLQDRFDSISRAELKRLDKKLARLSDAERRTVESLVGDIVAAIARVPERTLAEDVPVETLDALVRVFRLSIESSSA